MAESSIMWTTGATGDGATAYTQAQVILWQHNLLCRTSNEGINKGQPGSLAVTGASSPVAVSTGAAYVRGFPYFNTASVDVAVPTPSGNTRIDRVVLRANWSAQTVRITRIAGTEGTGTPPALVQTDGTTWDIPLAQASITTGGVITLTDEREYLHPKIMVQTSMLDDDAVTLAKMADDSVDSDQYVDGSIDLVHLSADSVDDTKAGNRMPQFYRRQGGSATIWSTVGTTARTPGAVRMQAGAIQWTGSAAANGNITVTFPTAFSYAPLILVSIASGTASQVAGVGVVTPSNVNLYWRDHTGGTPTAVSINWLAIGAE